MKIAFITTVNHNVGDDFVRDGLKFLLKNFYKDEIEFQNIHKHAPVSVRHGFEWVRNLRLSNIIDNNLPKWSTKDRVLQSDVLIQSGAPVYWCHGENKHCFSNEWYKPIIKDRFLKHSRGKFLNIAAGTCQRFHSDKNSFCSACLNYAKELGQYANVTTVRDALAKEVLSKVGIEAPLIPCSSIFAVNEYQIKSTASDYVVFSYMRGGSHYTFGQNINIKLWEKTIKDLYEEIGRTERIVFVCHSQTEYDEVRRLFPKADVFYSSKGPVEYANFYKRAKLGIMNRVHGAFMMASLGKPSVVIGNDTRAVMAKEIGLNSYFVNDMSTNLLLGEYHRLVDSIKTYPDKILNIKTLALQEYLKAFKGNL